MAEEIRVGLTFPVAPPVYDQDPLSEVWLRKPIRQHIKEFAQVFAALFLIIAAVMAYKGRSLDMIFGLTITALVLCYTGVRAPKVLHPVWRSWMKFAHVLAVASTFLILFFAWFTMMVPMSLVLKVSRIKVMDTSWRLPVESYWEKRDAKYDDFKLLERQY